MFRQRELGGIAQFQRAVANGLLAVESGVVDDLVGTRELVLHVHRRVAGERQHLVPGEHVIALPVRQQVLILHRSEADLAGEDRAFRAQAQNVGVGQHLSLVGDDPGDRVVPAFDPDDPGVCQDLAAPRFDDGRQCARELGGVAGFVGRTQYAASNAAARRSQRRLAVNDFLRVDNADLLAVGLQQAHVGNALIERLTAAVEVKNAGRGPVVLDRFLPDDRLQDRLGMDCKPMFEQRVATRPCGRALPQEAKRPRVEMRVGGEFETKRLVFLEQRLQQDFWGGWR